MTALLEAHEVRKHYGGVAAVDAASLAVEAGSITSLIGPNGAGKTTLFNIVTGFVRPDGGSVTLAGERVDGRPPHAVARRGLVRTFQTPRALTRMTVLENVLVGAPAHPGEHVWRLVATPRAGRRREASSASARSNCSGWSASTGLRTTTPEPSPAGNGSSSSSRGRS